jgi:hypothetical protein
MSWKSSKLSLPKPDMPLFPDSMPNLCGVINAHGWTRLQTIYCRGCKDPNLSMRSASSRRRLVIMLTAYGSVESFSHDERIVRYINKGAEEKLCRIVYSFDWAKPCQDRNSRGDVQIADRQRHLGHAVAACCWSLDMNGKAVRFPVVDDHGKEIQQSE